MFQLVTFNIGGARKLRGELFSPSQLGLEVAQALSVCMDTTQPTVIALQETGSSRAKSIHQSSFEWVAYGLGGGYRVAFAPELSTESHAHQRLWDQPYYRDIEWGEEGNALVTNLDKAEWAWQTRSFAQENGWATSCFISHAMLYSTGSRDTQPRNLQVASITHPHYGAVYILNTHLGTLSGEDRHDLDHPRSQAGEQVRLEQVAEIVRVMNELRESERAHHLPARPLILLGDFNAVPTSPSYRALCTHLRPLVVAPCEDEWTHCTHKILIDHVFVDDPLSVLPVAQAEILTTLPVETLSDHRPLWVRFMDASS